MIHWESQLERDAVYLFEFSPGVVRFREQPFSTYYALDANTRRYTPDFELTLYTGETTLIEIKPEEKLLDRDERRRLDCIHEHFVSKGHEYRILTERDIRQQELLKNLGMLMRHRGIPLTSYQRRLIEKRLIDISSISFANGAALLGDIASVWHLIDQRILFCDLRRLINQETIFSTIPNERFNEILLF